MDAGLELVNAAFTALRANAAVTAYVGNRIYDRVPEKQDGSPNVPTPYVSLGPISVIPADYDCLEGEEINFQLDVWSRGSGDAYSKAQAMAIGSAIRRVLHNAELTLSENAMVSLEHTLTRVMRDPDGVTHHAAIQFEATVETP